MTIQSSNRWSKLKFDSHGNALFIRYGQRYYIQDFIRIDNNNWDAQLGISNTCSLLIKVSECGEKVKTAIAF